MEDVESELIRAFPSRTYIAIVIHLAEHVKAAIGTRPPTDTVLNSKLDMFSSKCFVNLMTSFTMISWNLAVLTLCRNVLQSQGIGFYIFKLLQSAWNDDKCQNY